MQTGLRLCATWPEVDPRQIFYRKPLPILPSPPPSITRGQTLNCGAEGCRARRALVPHLQGCGTTPFCANDSSLRSSSMSALALGGSRACSLRRKANGVGTTPFTSRRPGVGLAAPLAVRRGRRVALYAVASNKNDDPVVIVGAGVAGLNCAAQLQKAGVIEGSRGATLRLAKLEIKGNPYTIVSNRFLHNWHHTAPQPLGSLTLPRPYAQHPPGRITYTTSHHTHRTSYA